jgi:phosphatidylinositol-3-phosphatase
MLGRAEVRLGKSGRRVLAAALAACVLAAAGCAGTSAHPPRALGPSAARALARGICGTVTSPPAYRHVIWIWLENHSYSQVIGDPARAPFLARLARQCGVATNYHNLTHPSLPNYVGATSGLPLAKLGRFDADCDPVPGCTTAAASIFGQGESWRAYEESMPSGCFRSDAGEYAVRHNPPPYFTGLAGCGRQDVPYPRLRADLRDGTLPAFSFVTPNLIDDMHDGTVSDGDAWLAANLPVILDSAEYRDRTTVVFITWDEGAGGSAGETCAANHADSSCRVAALVISPSTPAGTRSAAPFSHYSLLATTEELLGLPFLGEAAVSPTMTRAFRL